MSHQDAVKAKEYLNTIGYIVIWIHDEWRMMTKRCSKPERLKGDAQLLDFAKSKGWEPKGDADE